MLTILVDYENVNGSDGLKGVSDLTKNDKLIIFSVIHAKTSPKKIWIVLSNRGANLKLLN